MSITITSLISLNSFVGNAGYYIKDNNLYDANNEQQNMNVSYSPANIELNTQTSTSTSTLSYVKLDTTNKIILFSWLLYNNYFPNLSEITIQWVNRPNTDLCYLSLGLSKITKLTTLSIINSSMDDFDIYILCCGLQKLTNLTKLEIKMLNMGNTYKQPTIKSFSALSVINKLTSLTTINFNHFNLIIVNNSIFEPYFNKSITYTYAGQMSEIAITYTVKTSNIKYSTSTIANNTYICNIDITYDTYLQHTSNNMTTIYLLDPELFLTSGISCDNKDTSSYINYSNNIKWEIPFTALPNQTPSSSSTIPSSSSTIPSSSSTTQAEITTSINNITIENSTYTITRTSTNVIKVLFDGLPNNLTTDAIKNNVIKLLKDNNIGDTNITVSERTSLAFTNIERFAGISYNIIISGLEETTIDQVYELLNKDGNLSAIFNYSSPNNNSLNILYIILPIVFVVLILLGVGIYFLVRHYQNKN
jgi:hypothetical protein